MLSASPAKILPVLKFLNTKCSRKVIFPALLCIAPAFSVVLLLISQSCSLTSLAPARFLNQPSALVICRRALLPDNTPAFSIAAAAIKSNFSAAIILP